MGDWRSVYQVDLSADRIYADNLVPRLRKTPSRHCAHIAHTEDTDPHRPLPFGLQIP